MTANLVQYASEDGSITLEIQPADQFGNLFKGVWTSDGDRPPEWTSDNPNTKFDIPHAKNVAKITLPPGQRATITVKAYVKLGLPLPSKPEDYELLSATTVIMPQVPIASGICAVPISGTNWMLSKIVLALVLLLMVTGCSVTRGTRTITINGVPQVLEISNSRFLWASQAIDASVTDANGFTFMMKVQKSTVDNAALSTVVGLAKEGIAAAKSNTNSPSK